MGCYDRTIHNHVVLNSRILHIPNSVCKLYIIAHNDMNICIQIQNKIATPLYKSTTNIVLYGVGKGTGNGETKWNFTSAPMMSNSRRAGTRV